MTAPKPFCTCLHSWWSHRTGFYDATGKHAQPYQGGTLRVVCERIGCRCIEYHPQA